MVTAKIDLPMEAIAEFCHRWRIREFALFGSVLRDDFTPESDVDVLVEFDPEARVSLLDVVGMEEPAGFTAGSLAAVAGPLPDHFAARRGHASAGCGRSR